LLWLLISRYMERSITSLLITLLVCALDSSCEMYASVKQQTSTLRAVRVRRYLKVAGLVVRAIRARHQLSESGLLCAREPSFQIILLRSCVVQCSRYNVNYPVWDSKCLHNTYIYLLDISMLNSVTAQPVVR
jgi:hypothetical protein